MEHRTRWPVVLALVLAATPAHAQAPADADPASLPAAVPADAPPTDADARADAEDDEHREDSALNASRSRTLRGLANRIGEVEEEIAVTRRELRRAKDAVVRKEAEELVENLEGKLAELRRSFRGLATGLDLESIGRSPDDAIAWDSEASELLKPILRELREATKRPREIEKQRVRVTHFEERLPRIEQAIARVSRELAGAGPGRERQELKEARASLIEMRREVADQLQLAKARLAELQDNRESLVESTSNIVSAFFRSRGLNFFLALATFIGMFLLLRLLHRVISARLQQRQEAEGGIALRVFDLIAYAGTALTAVVGMLAVLYTAGDWVLLTLVVLLLAGVLWGARNWVPQLWEEIKLLLDIGSVRQGERLVFDGVPWRVESLQLVTALENPAFAHLQTDLKHRGVENGNALPNYHYRDDSRLLWGAIGEFAVGMVRLFYPTDQDVQSDTELQAWMRELASPEGCAIKGMPNDGALNTRLELSEFLTQTIYICSAQHASVNNGQYDLFGFVPNVPGHMLSPAPTTHDALGEEYVARALPYKKASEEQIGFTEVLSAATKMPLGKYARSFFSGDAAVHDHVARFQTRLREVGQAIDVRNSRLEVPYTYMHPKTVAQSIEI